MFISAIIQSHPSILDFFLLAYPLYVLVFIVAKYLYYLKPQKQKEKKNPMSYLWVL